MTTRAENTLRLRRHCAWEQAIYLRLQPSDRRLRLLFTYTRAPDASIGSVTYMVEWICTDGLIGRNMRPSDDCTQIADGCNTIRWFDTFEIPAGAVGVQVRVVDSLAPKHPGRLQVTAEASG